jgi:hypothetical protein
MKTYEQFAAELTPEQAALAQALFDSVYREGSLMCFSDREGDAKYFKFVPVECVGE